MICTGSDGSGYPFDSARCCAVCGVAFEDVSRVPVHFVREAEGLIGMRFCGSGHDE